MGLLDKLTNDGSVFSVGNGATPPTNAGATQQSKLHADGAAASYSVTGDNFGAVNGAFQSYNDGFNNTLPMPSQLDLNGQPPAFSTVPGSTQQLPYVNNLPG